MVIIISIQLNWKGDVNLHYYRTTGEQLADFCPDESAVNKYIENINIKLINNIWVDIDLFTTRKWKCDRFKCTYNSTEHNCGTCCAGGGIVSPVDEETVKKYIPDALKYLTIEKQEILKRGEICESKYKFNSDRDTCVFLSTISSDYCCSLHKVALDNNISILSVKTFDCCIEPLDVIVLNNGELFLTAITENNLDVGRWGNVLPCIVNPFEDSPFLVESMKETLINLFGSEFYVALESEIESRRKELGSDKMVVYL